MPHTPSLLQVLRLEDVQPIRAISVQVTGNIQGTFKEQPGIIQGTFTGRCETDAAHTELAPGLKTGGCTTHPCH
jgi:hypothetical protein